MPDNNELINMLRSVIRDELKPINERLAAVEAGQTELKQGQANLEAVQQELRQGQANLEAVQQELRQGQANLEAGQQELRQGQANLEAGQQGLRQGQANLEAGQQELRQGQGRLENKINKLEIRVENEVIVKVNALFDAREVQNDINQQILNTLQRVETKIDVLQMETAHIRRVK